MIEGKAKRYKPTDDDAPIYSAAQVGVLRVLSCFGSSCRCSGFHAVCHASCTPLPTTHHVDCFTYGAVQIAMMGGTLAEGKQDAAQQPPRKPGPQLEPAPQRSARTPGTQAMGVSEFLGKGVGGAQLPRKQQDRKLKEQKKRELGQSAIGSWKTEAEMLLRQTYD